MVPAALLTFSPLNQPAGISLSPGNTVTCSPSALDIGAAVCWVRTISEA